MLPIVKTIEIKDNCIVFPSIGYLYEFFSPRTKDINVWSIGFCQGGFEIHIAELTGAKIQVFDCRPNKKEAYTSFKKIMDTHLFIDTTSLDLEWAKKLADHWILPDSTSFHNYLPSEYSGNIMIDGLVSETKFTEVDHLDLCKIDYGDYTMTLVYSILNRGFRPGLFYLNWPYHPDENSTTMICAGHLQTCGYRLIGSCGNFFLYQFIDENMYEFCSWNDTTSANPMISELRKSLLNN